MSDYTDIYKNLLIKQYWDKTNAVAEVELRAGAYERVYQILRDFETAFDLDTATGDRLDKIGKIVGISREDLEPYFDLFFGFSDNPNSLPMGFKFSTYFTSEEVENTTWDSGFMGPQLSLSDGDLSVSHDAVSDWESVLATNGKSSGKWYWEAQRKGSTGIDYMLVGIANISMDLEQYIGQNINSYGYMDNDRYYHNGSYVLGGGTWSDVNDIIMMALDLDNGKLWFGKNGVWDGDPVAGTGEAFSGIAAGTWYPAATLYIDDSYLTGKFSTSNLSYSAPSGFIPIVTTVEVEHDTPEYTAGKFFDKFYTGTIPGVLTDDEYRFYIKAKIAVNSASGYMVSDNYISIQSVIQYLFDGYAIVFDDMVMSLTLEVEDSVPRGRVFLARDLNLLPRPQGVEYNAIALASYDYFGWDDDPNADGWGTWSDASIGGIFATYL